MRSTTTLGILGIVAMASVSALRDQSEDLDLALRRRELEDWTFAQELVARQRALPPKVSPPPISPPISGGDSELGKTSRAERKAARKKAAAAEAAAAEKQAQDKKDKQDKHKALQAQQQEDKRVRKEAEAAKRLERHEANKSKGQQAQAIAQKAREREAKKHSPLEVGALPPAAGNQAGHSPPSREVSGAGAAKTSHQAPKLKGQEAKAIAEKARARQAKKHSPPEVGALPPPAAQAPAPGTAGNPPLSREVSWNAGQVAGEPAEIQPAAGAAHVPGSRTEKAANIMAAAGDLAANAAPLAQTTLDLFRQLPFHHGESQNTAGGDTTSRSPASPSHPGGSSYDQEEANPDDGTGPGEYRRKRRDVDDMDWDFHARDLQDDLYARDLYTRDFIEDLYARELEKDLYARDFDNYDVDLFARSEFKFDNGY